MTDDAFGQEFAFKTQARLITEFSEIAGSEPRFAEFFEYNDMGVPLSQLIMMNQIEQLTTEGEQTIEETYQNLCDLFSKDSDEEFDDITDLMEE